jgi:MFS transporter, PPP family, 3-phenylpropionic acid transporter
VSATLPGPQPRATLRRNPGIRTLEGLAARLSLAQGGLGLLNGGILPFFGAYLAGRGLPPPAIAAVWSAGLLLQVVVSPLAGMVADARNDRRGALIACALVVLCGFSALHVVSGTLAITLAAIPAMVAFGTIFPLLDSVSVRLSERFGFDYGHVRRWASIAFVAGNLLSGFLVSGFGVESIAGWLSGSAALCLIAMLLLPKAARGAEQQSFRSRFNATLGEAKVLMRTRVFIVFLLACAMDQGSHAFYYAYGGLHWRQLGYSGSLIGIIWPLGVLAEIAFMSMSLRLFNRFGATNLLLAGTITCVLRWTIMAFDPPFPMVVFAQVLHGGTYALAHLGAMYFIVKAVPPRLAATAQTLYAVFVQGFGEGIGAAVSGPLFALYGGRTYLLMTAMGAAGVVLTIMLARSWSKGRILADSDVPLPITI